jgi:hypothetical protein
LGHSPKDECLQKDATPEKVQLILKYVQLTAKQLDSIKEWVDQRNLEDIGQLVDNHFVERHWNPFWQQLDLQTNDQLSQLKKMMETKHRLLFYAEKMNICTEMKDQLVTGVRLTDCIKKRTTDIIDQLAEGAQLVDCIKKRTTDIIDQLAEGAQLADRIKKLRAVRPFDYDRFAKEAFFELLRHMANASDQSFFSKMRGKVSQTFWSADETKSVAFVYEQQSFSLQEIGELNQILSANFENKSMKSPLIEVQEAHSHWPATYLREWEVQVECDIALSIKQVDEIKTNLLKKLSGELIDGALQPVDDPAHVICDMKVLLSKFALLTSRFFIPRRAVDEWTSLSRDTKCKELAAEIKRRIVLALPMLSDQSKGINRFK